MDTPAEAGPSYRGISTRQHQMYSSSDHFTAKMVADCALAECVSSNPIVREILQPCDMSQKKAVAPPDTWFVSPLAMYASLLWVM
ncbi:hypothetical protein EJ05DRAFT_372217 [Pseudovirgaria hyperparasitica]|uniref:Uncharacterized protein n=1 Tax=Pseudovirgaria hyperparasitica TaxID=470096 RepID=A0A6A6W7D1_9PEZI|nr:uncharacterized protein EJ05DRAFT_372217 [Pseudovirgaria hyperparasitica]KAF2757934.1 hypothetical protein EJ05DRAFT_372217 [Pseudovirgaria hyperparasitica]